MSKKDAAPETTPDPVSSLKAENDALRATQDQMVDMLVEMREKLEALESRQSAPMSAAPQVEPEDLELAALIEEFKDVPNIQILEHRIAHGTDAPAALRLKAAPGGLPEPTVAEDPHGETCFWKLRWFNFAIEGRAERFVNEGYTKVERTELMDPESIPNLAEGPIVKKGERGQEVLGKIPRKIFEFKKRRDAQRAGRLMQSASGLRDHVANGVASMAGRTGGNADQAGSTVHRQFDVSITPGVKERVTL